jgi:dTDP-4-amino-4,6-dideoxygalactose transaminase
MPKLNQLAIDGGKPVRKDFLPFHRPWFGEEEEKAVIAVLRSGWVTKSGRTVEFEKQFAKYTGAKFAVGLNSCTAALHLSLVALGIRPGDEVITTPITFAATANVIEHVGAKPVFADVRRDDLNIDPGEIKQKLTSKIKAIMPVHFGGAPCDMDEIFALAKKRNIPVIEDAAHAVETMYKGKKIGGLDSASTCFSFYANKNITTGEGGMLTTNDQQIAEKVQVLSLHGISRDAWKRYSMEGYRHWDIIYPGYKYNMFDIQAALGIEQLKKVDMFWKKRKQIVERYNQAFSDEPALSLLSTAPENKNAYYLYVLVIRTEDLKADRDQIMNAVQAEGVGIGIHFRNIAQHPYYKDKYGYKTGSLPEAEYVSDRVLSIPLFPAMTESEADSVIEAVTKVIEHYRK